MTSAEIKSHLDAQGDAALFGASMVLGPELAMAGLERLSATRLGYWLNQGQEFRMGVSGKFGDNVYRVAGESLGKIPEPIRDFLGIKQIGSSWKWDLWNMGPK